MEPSETEARIEAPEEKVRNLQDIEEINRLQRAYGFYIEHWMSQEIIDLFADDVSLTLAPVLFSVGKV